MNAGLPSSDMPGPGASLVVAVDGPSGSGKSSVARQVALALGLRYLDTGAMYRALTWWALELSVDPEDRAAVAELARRMPLRMGTDPAAPSVQVAGTHVTTAIRASRISAAVSAVATNLDVRSELVARQREYAREGAVVIEGRDITTVVAPDAAVRVLLTASESARLGRRARELHGRDDAAALAATRAQVLHRDDRDATVAAFRDPAEGVVVIDSSQLTLDETVATLLRLVEDRTGVRPR